MNRQTLAWLTILALAVTASSLRADDAALKKLAKENVQTLNDSVIKGDYGKVIDFTHPKLVEMMGGREKAIALMENSTKEMKKEGFEFKSVKVGDPSDIVKQANELYLYVPFELTMKIPKRKITAPSYVIGVSTDQGKTWKYVDGMGGENMNKILPDLPASLKLPEKKKPTIEKD